MEETKTIGYIDQEGNRQQIDVADLPRSIREEINSLKDYYEFFNEKKKELDMVHFSCIAKKSHIESLVKNYIEETEKDGEDKKED